MWWIQSLPMSNKLVLPVACLFAKTNVEQTLSKTPVTLSLLLVSLSTRNTFSGLWASLFLSEKCVLRCNRNDSNDEYFLQHPFFGQERFSKSLRDLICLINSFTEQNNLLQTRQFIVSRL